jgi:hypothetical protein
MSGMPALVLQASLPVTVEHILQNTDVWVGVVWGWGGGTGVMRRRLV